MPRRCALPFALLSILLAVNPLAAQSPEIESLREKAEKGNSIAQYNLGLAYQAGRDVTADWPEAYVWLSLASENGTTGKALQNLIAVMSPAQLAEGQRRLAALRGPTPLPSTGSAPTSTPVTAMAATAEDDPQKRLSAELALAWREADQLKARLDAANTARDQATAELAASTRELAALRANVAGLQSEQTAASSAEVGVLQNEIARLKTIATEMGNHNQALEDAAALRGRTLAETQAALAQATARADELNRNLSELQASRDATASDQTSAATALTNTRQELAAARNLLTVAQSAQAGTARELQATQAVASNRQQTLERVQGELAGLQQELAATKSELSSGADEISALRATIANLQGARESQNSKEIAALQTELKRVKADAAVLGTTNQQLEDTAAERDRQLDEIRAQLAQAHDRIDKLGQSEQTLRAQLARQPAPVDPDPALTERIANLSAELADALDAVVAAQMQTTQQQSLTEQQQTRLVELRDELADRENQISSAGSRISTLERELAAAQTVAPQAGKMDDSRVTELTEEIVTLKGQLDNVQSGRAALATQVDSLSTDLGATRAQLAGLKGENETLTARLAAATQPAAVSSDPADIARIKSLESELAQARDQLSEVTIASTETAELTQKLNDHRGEIETLQAELAREIAARSDADRQAQALNTELADARRELDETKTQLAGIPTDATPADDDSELAEVQSKLSMALSSYSRLQDENDSSKAAAAQLAEQVARLETQLALANSTSTDLSARLDTSATTVAQMDVLREQLRQTSDQLNSVRRENADLRTRLAIITPSPSSAYSTPTRPGSAAAVSAVVAQPTPPPVAVAPAAAAATPRSHTVVPGDTLSGIALRYYGTSIRWAEIYEANRANLPNERALRIGMQLVIP